MIHLAITIASALFLIWVAASASLLAVVIVNSLFSAVRSHHERGSK